MIGKNRKRIGWFRGTNTILGAWYFREGYVYSCSRRVLSSKISRLYAPPSLEGTRKNLFRFPFPVSRFNEPSNVVGDVVRCSLGEKNRLSTNVKLMKCVSGIKIYIPVPRSCPFVSIGSWNIVSLFRVWVFD